MSSANPNAPTTTPNAPNAPAAPVVPTTTPKKLEPCSQRLPYLERKFAPHLVLSVPKNEVEEIDEETYQVYIPLTQIGRSLERLISYHETDVVKEIFTKVEPEVRDEVYRNNVSGLRTSVQRQRAELQELRRGIADRLASYSTRLLKFSLTVLDYKATKKTSDQIQKRKKKQDVINKKIADLKAQARSIALKSEQPFKRKALSVEDFEDTSSYDTPSSSKTIKKSRRGEDSGDESYHESSEEEEGSSDDSDASSSEDEEEENEDDKKFKDNRSEEELKIEADKEHAKKIRENIKRLQAKADQLDPVGESSDDEPESPHPEEPKDKEDVAMKDLR